MMDEEIINRIQSLEFRSVKLTEYLISNTSSNKSDYIVENHFINNRRRQLYELNEALNSELIDKNGFEFLCRNSFFNHEKRVKECKSTSVSFGLKNIQNIDFINSMTKPEKAQSNIKLNDPKLNEFLQFRKENFPEYTDLTSELSNNKINRIDLNLFEKKAPLTNQNQGSVFKIPSVPTSNPPAPTNDSINNVPSYEPLQPQKPLYKPSPMNNNVNQTNGFNQGNPYAASTMNSAAPNNTFNANKNTNPMNNNSSLTGMGGNNNNSPNSGMNSNQQYFAKLNAMKYEPSTSRCYKRRKEDEPEKDEDSGNYEQPSVPFKSARDQLLIDNAKKNNQQPQQNTQSSQAKRPMNNMPARGGNGGGGGTGIHKKFNLPMPKNDEEKSNNNNNNMQNNQDQNMQELANVKNIDQKLIDTIMSEVMDKTPAITWNDIAGLEFVKKTIKEIVIWPMLRPDIFNGLRGPPKGLLLFGPPGTGKTLIAKTIANESRSTFFNISSSVLTSKWQGESEKLVKVLFEVARSFQPSVIFIDEIDSLLSQRSDEDRESSRRLKTEFFIQMDGCSTSADERILLIGATNRPQELDDAARRRFVKKLYIPLPEQTGRRQIIMNLMSKQGDILNEEEIARISEITDGYSGADMTNLCREAAIGPIRSLESSSIINISVEQVRSINFQDFIDAMQQVRASVSSSDLEAYFKWNSQFGTMAIQKG